MRPYHQPISASVAEMRAQFVRTVDRASISRITASRRRDRLGHRQAALEEPQPPAIDQLDVHPVDQQGGGAELPHPAPAGPGRIAGPQERKGKHQERDPLLGQDLRGAVQPVVRFLVQRKGQAGEVLAGQDQHAAHDGRPLHRPLDGLLGHGTDNAAGAHAEGQVSRPREEAEKAVIGNQVVPHQPGKAGRIQSARPKARRRQSRGRRRRTTAPAPPCAAWPSRTSRPWRIPCSSGCPRLNRSVQAAGNPKSNIWMRNANARKNR